MKSIIQQNKECYYCKTTLNLHKHHIYGGANRNISEQNGFWVYLCATHHDMSDDSVHFNKEMCEELQKDCQRIYCEDHTIREFRKLIGRNFL